MKNTFPIISLLLVFSILTNNCTKSPCRTTYSFDIPLSISPALDTFQIGDTIWLTSTIKNQLQDKNSNEFIDVSNYDFKLESALNKVDTNIIFAAEPYFEYLYEEGEFDITEFASSNVITKVSFDENASNKRLKIGMIPSITGVFIFSFYNLTADLKDVNLTDSDCIENLTVSFVMNDGGDNNFELMDENRQQEVVDKVSFEKEGLYAFMVIE